MTALKQYIRLESTGNWQASLAAVPCEVIVSFGKSTLMIRDESDAALTHWALSATHIVNAGDMGTTYSPDPEAMETLHITDRAMIDAIAQVTAARTPKGRVLPRRGRLVALLGALAMAGLLVALGPDLLQTYTAYRISPLAKEAIATGLLRNIERERGAACGPAEADAVFRQIGRRILPGKPLRVTMVALLGAPTASLPGGRILLDPRAFANMRDPEELAGWLVQETLRARRNQPMAAMLKRGSLRATLDLLSTGTVDPDLMRQTAATIGAPLSGLPPSLDQDIARTLGLAGLPSLPFATAIAREGGSFDRVRRLRAGNTIAIDTAFEPALSDQDWVLLKGICGA